MADSPPPRTTWLELAKAAFWPALALIAFIDFHDPLRRTLELLPKEFERASKIQYGSLLVEVREQAKNSPFSDLAETLGNFDSDSVELLLRVRPDMEALATENNQSNERYIPDEPTMAKLLGLEANKLIVFNNYTSNRKLANDVIPFAFVMEDVKRIKPYKLTNSTDVLATYGYRFDSKNPDMQEIAQTTYTLTDKGAAGVKAIIRAVASTLNADKQ